MHRAALGEADSGGVLDVQQFPQDSFLGVIGTGGVARRGTDSAVSLGKQIGGGEFLGGAVAPGPANVLVQLLGKGLGKPVGQRLDHDRIVIVVIRLEKSHQRVGAMEGYEGWTSTSGGTSPVPAV